MLGNGFKNGIEYRFMKSKNGLYKIIQGNRTVYKTYDYKDMMRYFDNVL